MITLGVPQLVGMIALCSAAVGLLVLGIMAWRVTGQLDAAYNDGYNDGLRAGARPEPRHAAPTATLPALRPLPPALLSPAPAAPAEAFPSTDTGIEMWITGMRERADAWLEGLLADANR